MVPGCSHTSTTTTNYGCPTCGCTCGDGQTISFGDFIGRDIHEIFQIGRLLGSTDIDWPAITEEPLFERQQPPRRMKRPFPRDLPGPRQCHFNSRPRHRRLMRIRRLWRNRSSSRYAATAASSTPRSRNGNTVAAVLSAHRR